MNWTHPLLLLLAGPAVAAPPALASEVAQIVREDNVEEICRLLRSLPEWPAISDPGNEESDALAQAKAEELERIMEEIATFDTDSLREAVVRYDREIHYRRTKAVEEHLILLNRFLFNLPERVVRSSPHFRMLLQGGGLGGRKKVVADAQLFGFDSDELPARWPWYEDFDGRWRFWLTRGMNGALITFGPPYPAVDVFDYCLREFGRRDVDVESSVAE
jgi:hypothetical protein